MKFVLTTTEITYTDWIEKHIKQVPILKELGFEFVHDRSFNHWTDGRAVNTYRIHGTPITEVVYLKELVDLSNKLDCELIIKEGGIRIYNGYE